MTSSLLRHTVVSVVLLSAALSAPATADVVALLPVQDATLYENPNGDTASGSGPTFFAGRTAIGFEDIRRGLLQFDVGGSVPPGATITGVQLTLYMSRTVAGDVSFSLHRVTQAWGEGTSNAGVNGGSGVGAQPGDATWLNTFYSPTSPPTWTTPGGDFLALVSAAATVGNSIGFYTWGSTAEMVADAQDWLDNGTSNFGWLLKDDESSPATAKRFDSREAPVGAADTRPTLTIEYRPEAVPVTPVTWTGIKSLFR